VFKQLLPGLVIGLSLLACEPDDKAPVQHDPVAFESADECHLCGMIITRFPGPKGEAFVRHNQTAFKFCSTRDLFAWLLQPDVSSRVEAVYVHDMAKVPWEDPQDHALVDARGAWYVVGSERTGAMGSTLASFAEPQAAADFAQQYGGKVVRFDDITLQLLQ
jgi:copper chaperone NosL